jgi:hypothetical protein
MKFERFGQTFEKYSNVNFHANLSSGNRAVLADGQADMTKLIAGFHNSANVSQVMCVVTTCTCVQMCVLTN